MDKKREILKTNKSFKLWVCEVWQTSFQAPKSRFKNPLTSAKGSCKCTNANLSSGVRIPAPLFLSSCADVLHYCLWAGSTDKERLLPPSTAVVSCDQRCQLLHFGTRKFSQNLSVNKSITFEPLSRISWVSKVDSLNTRLVLHVPFSLFSMFPSQQ